MATATATTPTILEAAIAHTRLGRRVIPIPARDKNPNRRGWQNERLAEADLPRRFAGNVNVGMLTGEPSGWLVDVDCDVPEACEAARELLPPTDMRHGRAGNPDSHYWYIARGAKPAQFEFQENDADPTTKTMLIELRSTGRQTVVPPSIHPTGDAYTWACQGAPAEVTAGWLHSLVGRVAACALIARHWPTLGSRDKAAMALAGMLKHGGWDTDKADRFVMLVARIAGDEEWRTKRRDKATQAARKLQAGQAVTGAPTLAETLRDGQRVVEKAREWLGLNQSAEQPKMPDAPKAEPSNDDEDDNSLNSSRVAPWPDPMAEAAFIGPVGTFVKKLEKQTEAAREGLLVQALAAAGNAMGRHAHCIVEADEHHTNLFAVMVGGTGARKGVSWGHVRRYVKRADPTWEGDHIVNGLSTGEGLINVVRDGEPVIPDKVALAFESEFAAVFKVKGREGNTLSTVLRQAWDGDTLRTLTKNTPLKATGAHISIVGHITPDELRRLITDTDASNGFANRILWVCMKRARYLPHGGDEVNVNNEVTALLKAIEQGKQAGRLKRDKEADALWEKRYRDLSSGRPGLLGAVTNRAEAQVTRLSLIYALLDKSPDIKKWHLEAALAVWDYCLASARYIFGAALGDAFVEELDAELIKRGEQGMSRTEIHAHFGNNRSADEIASALGTLESQSRAEKRKVMGAAGRHVCRWYATNTNNENNEFNETSALGDRPPEPALVSLNSLNSYPADVREYLPTPCPRCREPRMHYRGEEIWCDACGQRIKRGA